MSKSKPPTEWTMVAGAHSRPKVGGLFGAIFWGLMCMFFLEKNCQDITW